MIDNRHAHVTLGSFLGGGRRIGRLGESREGLRPNRSKWNFSGAPRRPSTANDRTRHPCRSLPACLLISFSLIMSCECSRVLLIGFHCSPSSLPSDLLASCSSLPSTTPLNSLILPPPALAYSNPSLNPRLTPRSVLVRSPTSFRSLIHPV